jgi:hypothetical protein
MNKWSTTDSEKVWNLRLESSGGNKVVAFLRCGTVTYQATISGVVTNSDCLVAMTFDGVSDLNVYGIDSVATVTGNNNTSGAINSSSTPVHIGDFPPGTASAMDGIIYWAAFYNSELSQTELEGLFSQAYHPQGFSPMMYIDFHQAVAATYTTEGGEYVLDVSGSPLHGGSSESSAEMPHLIEKGIANPWATGFRTAAQRSAAQHCGNVELGPLVEKVRTPEPTLTDAWWDFTANNGVDIESQTADDADFDIPNNDHISWAVIVELDTDVDAEFIWKWWTGGRGYYAYYVSSTPQVTFRWQGSVGQATPTISGATPTGEKVLIAGVLENTGVDTYDAYAYRISTSGGTETASDLANSMATFTTNQHLDLFGKPSDASNLDGKAYFAGIWVGTAVSQAQLEGLFNGTLKPTDISNLVMSWEGTQVPAATYATEQGGYTLDVSGTPNGYETGPGPSQIIEPAIPTISVVHRVAAQKATARHRGSAIIETNTAVADYTPLPLDDYWTQTNTLLQLTDSAQRDDFNITQATHKFSAVAVLDLASFTGKTSIFEKAGGAWELFLTNPGFPELDAELNGFQAIVYPTLSPVGNIQLYAMTYDGAGTLRVYSISSGGVDTNTNAVPSVIAPASNFHVGGGTLGGSGAPVNGKMYWAAFWYGTELSQAQLQSLFDQTVHPISLSPRMFIDYHKVPLLIPAYVAEVGTGPNAPYEFDITAGTTPTHYGTGLPSTPRGPDTELRGVRRLTTGQKDSARHRGLASMLRFSRTRGR